MNDIIKIDYDKYKRIFVCSDVHNDYSSLNRGINELSLTNSDLLIIAGDLLDRGLFPDKCLRLCLKNWKETEPHQCDIVYLKGNHEQMLYEYIEDNYCDDIDFKMRYNYNTIELLKHRSGGGYTREDFIQLAERLKKLPLMVEIKDNKNNVLYRIGHAALPTEEHIDSVSDIEEYILWGANRFYYNSVPYSGSDNLVLIVGHSHTKYVRWILKELTGEEIEDNKVWFSKSDNNVTLIDIDCGNGSRKLGEHKLAFLNIKTNEVSYF